ncbi:guanine nucleotide-binding protein subunit gamma 1 isoform X2 [Aegilops tauschii subsp. strangulata]|uniref:guanine nucleotide-binding protein subunit gamma 1 isoform X2 n=1 Tax=Aegilops tauschii subsp. strangulata TaxID=200361 RepID=UPI001E230496
MRLAARVCPPHPLFYTPSHRPADRPAARSGGPLAAGATPLAAMQVPGDVGGGGGEAGDMRGRHRIQAELKKLEQEARFLEEELEELNKMDKVSTALQETTGAAYQSWDRWFEGPQDLRRCKCWFL